MTARENFLSTTVQFVRRRAATPRPEVDQNGRPTGPAIVYTYDAAGHLVSAATEGENYG